MTIAAALDYRSEDQNDPQVAIDHRSEDQNDPQICDPPTDYRSEDQNDPPPVRTYFEEEERTDTHTPRTSDYKSEDQNDPQPTTHQLPLLGRLSPTRCAHPHAHAWCEGRVHVPRDLHFEFLDRLDTRPGETPSAKAGRLIAFYASTLAAIPATQPIGAEPYKFWRKAFTTFAVTPPHGEARTRPVRARAIGPTYESLDAPEAVARRQREEDARRQQDAREADARVVLEAMDPATYAALQADVEADGQLVAFKGRMLPEAYAHSVRLAMIRLLADRQWAEERAGRLRQGGAAS